MGGKITSIYDVSNFSDTMNLSTQNMKKCEVLELMELQLGRREREERQLRLDLDSTQQELNTLKISRMQIEAEVQSTFTLKN